MFDKPKIGTKVEVIIRQPDQRIFAQNQIREILLVGTVIADVKNTPPGHFRLAVNCEHVPNREINLLTVSAIKLANGTQVAKVSKPAEQVKTWAFKGSRGDNYTVTRTGSSYHCTCPGFTFRKNCKHTKLAAASK